MKTQRCPICESPVEPNARYPRYLCPGCAALASGPDGRPLSFANEGIDGGYAARYADTGDPYESHECFVKDIACWATEARFGGIVIEARNKQHQRVGSISNAHVGADFERVAMEFYRKKGIVLSRNFPLEIGLARKKIHCFDLGSSTDKLIVECKSHRWTAGDRVPSAKMTVWNEAMYYFHLAPPEFRKTLFVLHDTRKEGGESLLAYYKRTYSHLIPADVEFMEWDEATGDIVRL
jgi:hypothetical protein